MKHTRKAPIPPASAEFTSFPTTPDRPRRAPRPSAPAPTLGRLEAEAERRSQWVSCVSRPRLASHQLCHIWILSCCSHLLEMCPDALLKGNSKQAKPEHRKPSILHETHSCPLGHFCTQPAIHGHPPDRASGGQRGDVSTSLSPFLGFKARLARLRGVPSRVCPPSNVRSRACAEEVRRPAETSVCGLSCLLPDLLSPATVAWQLV